MADAHTNFAYSLVATAPTPSTTGTSLAVTNSTQAGYFPAVPFNATVWPANSQPTSVNAEIVRVTNISSATFTITRKQEGTSTRDIQVGDQIAATITTKTLVDAEAPMVTWSPYILSSGAATGVQTLAAASGQLGTGSLLVFPINVSQRAQFNQIVLPVQLSYVSTSNSGRDTYYSYFGLYSMNASTALSRFAAGSFSMAESYNSFSRTWSYATTTHTSGYGYDTLAMTATAELVNYISGTRWFGLQFGSEVHLNNGVYWLGIMSARSTSSNSSGGLSVVGVVGQPIDPYQAVGSVSGYNPIGVAPANWGGANQANSTAWWGRRIVGFVTQTALANFGGTTVPASIALSALAASAAASTATILPAVTLQSNLMT